MVPQQFRNFSFTIIKHFHLVYKFLIPSIEGIGNSQIDFLNFDTIAL